MGLDLRKPVEVLETAYNDAAGVTAAFNLNLLRRINRELGADFNLDQFSHLAFYNRDEHQIEMHLQSCIAQEVEIAELGLRVAFQPEETIHTEISRKFDAAVVAGQLAPYGFETCAQWTDERKWFLMIIFRFTGQDVENSGTGTGTGQKKAQTGLDCYRRHDQHGSRRFNGPERPTLDGCRFIGSNVTFSAAKRALHRSRHAKPIRLIKSAECLSWRFSGACPVCPKGSSRCYRRYCRHTWNRCNGGGGVLR